MNITHIPQLLVNDVTSYMKSSGLDFNPEETVVEAPDIVFKKNGIEVHRHTVVSLGSYA